MNWFAKFEKKFSKYAIKNLMFYIIVLYAIGFVMNTFFNGLYDAYFSLDFQRTGMETHHIHITTAF